MSEKTKSVTVLLPSGRLPLDIMAHIYDFATKYELGVYCSLTQNIRILGVPESKVAEIQELLLPLGVQFKGPGKFPLPRVCVSKPHCNLGQIDIVALSDTIMARFGERQEVKGKYKIALSACPLGCSGVKTTDIGVATTKKGFELFVGGRGGPFPKIGRRVMRGASEDQILDAIGVLADFHALKTEKKQRMYKFIDDPDFPFTEV